MSDPKPIAELHPGLTLLEIMYHWPRTQEVFARYQQVTGVCLACQDLFTTLEQVAVKYHLDLNQILGELQEAIGRGPAEE